MKCDDRLLLSIIDDLLIEADSDAITQHVDVCSRCQQRLTELAGDEDSWHEAAIALAAAHPRDSSIVIAIDPEMTSDMPIQADAISLDFLDPPSHPEMLGRIGRYEVERLLGAGGMGVVLKAFDTELHRPVAVKVLAPHLAHHGGARQRFAREAQSAAAVVHNNVVPIHNVDVAGKFPFLVMQYVAGESLQARVDRVGPLSSQEVLRIGIQIADGLAAAHEQGLVHRDVKPGNILLEESIDRVLISDFGLARAGDDASVTRSGWIAGTPHYMSPEQARGESVDARSDLYSLGCVLYFMCASRPPFRANGTMAVLNRICHEPHRPVDEHNHCVPAGLADLIDDLLEKDPAKRYSSAFEVKRELIRLLQSSSHTRRTRSQQKTSIRRRVGLVCITTLALMMLIGSQILRAWNETDGQSPPARRNPIDSVASQLRADDATAVEPRFANREEAQIDSVKQLARPSTLPFATSPAEAMHADAIPFRDIAFFDELRQIEVELQEFESSEAMGPSDTPRFDELELRMTEQMLDEFVDSIEELSERSFNRTLSNPFLE